MQQTSSRIYRQKFGALIPGIHVTPFPFVYHGITSEMAMDELEQIYKDTLHEEDVAAIIIEPVLGEGGYCPAPPKFLKQVRDFAHSKDALMICDEVQTGFGRTGSLFACDSEYYGDIQPDLLCMAKGIASGFPLSAVATRREIADACDPGMLGGTYAGNALSCAAAVETQKVIQEEGMVENSRKMGERLRENLRNIQSSTVSKGLIGDVRGLGLMTGLEFVKEAEPGIKARMSQACLDEGLLLLGCSTYEVVRFAPALNITAEDVDKGTDMFEKALRSI
jgi:4-aminobutyrate aminotransferase